MKKKLKFQDAYELASWINKNISCPLKQEQLMLKGIRNNYEITL